MTTAPNQKATYIPATLPSLHSASERLLSGHLVSFPTETVYGLGAHALDETAIQKIFAAKERPTTDPLIVHLNSLDQALPLWSATAKEGAGERILEKTILSTLTAHFWTGPLTIVAHAADCVPALLMAGTGYVACRSPRHPIARALIAGGDGCDGIPIAAPSANKFGHVSPTRPRHVMDDLGEEDVWIVDPGLGSLDDVDCGCCDVGVESTVVKVEMMTTTEQEENGGVLAKIILLRHGAVSEGDIADCLRKTPYGKEDENGTLADNIQLVSKPRTTGENVSHVAPGQTIRHYSPNVLSYIVSRRRHSAMKNSDDTTTTTVGWNDDERLRLRTSVIIDFGGRLKSTQSLALAYRDLDEGGDSNVAAANVFDALRWSETVEGADRVYFPEIEDDNGCCDDGGDSGANALVLAVKDRLTRAASGIVVDTLI